MNKKIIICTCLMGGALMGRMMVGTSGFCTAPRGLAPQGSFRFSNEQRDKLIQLHKAGTSPADALQSMQKHYRETNYSGKKPTLEAIQYFFTLTAHRKPNPKMTEQELDQFAALLKTNGHNFSFIEQQFPNHDRKYLQGLAQRIERQERLGRSSYLERWKDQHAVDVQRQTEAEQLQQAQTSLRRELRKEEQVPEQPWTPEEDQLLLQRFAEIGPHWTLLKKYFPGRTGNNIKNHYNALIRKIGNAGLVNGCPIPNIPEVKEPPQNETRQPERENAPDQSLVAFLAAVERNYVPSMAEFTSNPCSIPCLSIVDPHNPELTQLSLQVWKNHP